MKGFLGSFFAQGGVERLPSQCERDRVQPDLDKAFPLAPLEPARPGDPSHAAAKPQEQTPEFLLEQALARHDWHYRFSDDGRAQARGRESERNLLVLASGCAPDSVRQLWNRYYPGNGSPPLPAFAAVESTNQATEQSATTRPSSGQVEPLPAPTPLVSPSACPPWDLEEAERRLAELRAEVTRVERDAFGGRLPTPVATVLADAVAIAEGYVRNHEAEAARGWDALALLGGVLRRVQRCVEDWRKMGRSDTDENRSTNHGNPSHKEAPP
jgi:hypothetical protein